MTIEKLEEFIYWIASLSYTYTPKLAGIRVGDIIEKIDGIKLNKINDLRKHIYTKNVNDEVNLTILRNKQEFEITAKLTKKMFL